MTGPGSPHRLRLVAVCGPKGSGKTTAARFAERWLRRQGRAVTHVTFFRLNTAPNLRRAIRLVVPGFGGPQGGSAPEGGASDRVSSGPGSGDLLERGADNELLRNLSLLADIAVFRLYLSWLRIRRTEVAVCDRYFYDAYARAIKSGTRLWGVVERWTPRPDAAFALSVDPADGVRRRPLYDERHFRADDQAYLEMSRRHPFVIRVPPAPKRIVHEALVRGLEEALPPASDGGIRTR